MFQIDNSTAVAAIPAPTPAGPPGYFTDGNPATGVSATILPAEFMNMLMMENMNVLSAAGITPAKGQYNQLALAIAKIVQGGAAGQASETAAGILKLSTNPQALAGTDDSTAITPLKLAQKLANFLGQATEAAFGWLKIATQAIVSAGVDDTAAVTPKKLAAVTQAQAFTAFTAGGTAPAFTLTPTPAISAYVLNQRFTVTFGLAGGATPTLNVSGRGAKNLKQFSPTGAKVTAVITAGFTSDVVYDGTDFIVLDPLAVNARSVTDGDFNVPIYARQSVAIPQGQGLSFWDTTVATALWYRTGHDTSIWSFITAPGGGASEISAFSIVRSTGRVIFTQRPQFGGEQPWDSGNFDPATKINGNNCPEAGFASGDKGFPFMRHTDATVVNLATAASAFGVGQNYVNRTGSRVSGATYPNNTGKRITIIVNMSSGSGGSVASATVAGNAGVKTVGQGVATTNFSLSFDVPIGATYSFNSGSSSITSVWEITS
ncbi:hypothetical protein V6L78_28090 [Pseudomonas canadensis]|uniref:hypothetical protein n=1 Tax=Pseudomonas canadensis TaxID=915099 RepID=UPI0030CCCEA2